MKHQPSILHIAIPTPLRQIFDYLLPETIDLKSLKPGIRIKVPFGKRETIGILLSSSNETDIHFAKLKPIIQILDSEPVIEQSILNLCQWSSDYYHHSIGDVLSHAIPKQLREGKTIEEPPSSRSLTAGSKKSCAGNIFLDPAVKPRDDGGSSNSAGQLQKKHESNIILNDAQEQAIQAIVKKFNQFQCFLLNGITGSGKTEVYLNVIKKILEKDQQALVLVPEIALTPQTIQRFSQRFDVPVACLHSGLNDRERLTTWLSAKSGKAKIIIGTRSAIFTPIPNLGIIIIDEEHDMSFKQQDGFRYSARDLAIVRANMKKIPIILGSATPSLETLYNAEIKRYQTLPLPERAGNAIHPTFRILDIRDVRLNNGLSQRLLKVIEKHLQEENQVLIFLNRRGYAPTLMCHSCGWIANCSRCDAHMTLHLDPPHLHCHHCDTRLPIYRSCPSCKNKNLRNVGVGTEQLESALKNLFPNAQTVRIDRDTTRRKNALNNILETIQQGQRQILIGTQMLAKGHDFPNVTLVAIINADNGFFSADFRTTERTGQLLIQVAGRAGRAEKPGEVFIQTLFPEHPLLLKLTKDGYGSFAKLALKERKESELPPYAYFALLRAEAIAKSSPEIFLNETKEIAAPLASDQVLILGPIPSPMPRRQNHYRAQLLFRSSNRSQLQKLLTNLISKVDELKSAKKVKWSLDVDPLEMY